MAATHETIAPATSTPPDPFPYGWRYVERRAPEGHAVLEQVPLTLEDVLHPQEGDQVARSDVHQRICVYLYNVFHGLVAAMQGAVVLHDVRVAWDVPDLKAHGPDLAVIFGVGACKGAVYCAPGTFDVAQEGVRPTIIVEVTSPETRSIDLTDKLEEYDLAGVALYIIVDLVRRRDQIVPRLLGYQRTPALYAVLPPDERGWLWLEPLKAWLGLEGSHVVCYDESGAAIGDYAELQVALDAEVEARVAAEQRVQELEAELRRLRRRGVAPDIPRRVLQK